MSQPVIYLSQAEKIISKSDFMKWIVKKMQNGGNDAVLWSFATTIILLGETLQNLPV
jgi:hypothetical protein